MRVPVAADYSVAVSGTRSSRFSFKWRLENDKNLAILIYLTARFLLRPEVGVPAIFVGLRIFQIE